MKPIANDIESEFQYAKDFYNSESSLIESVLLKINILLPYENNALEFYHDQLYQILFDNRNLLVFGHDLSGYFFLCKKNKEIGYLYKEDSEWRLKYCNKNLDEFICFNNIFISMVHRKIEYQDRFDPEKIIPALEQYFCDVDEHAMKVEKDFWPTRLYEFSDGFFPLGDARVKFYQDLAKATD
ncbi:hypothetical protein ACI6Q2_02865 [Chitinophagaceae bacterium LWZ2-11]